MNSSEYIGVREAAKRSPLSQEEKSTKGFLAAALEVATTMRGFVLWSLFALSVRQGMDLFQKSLVCHFKFLEVQVFAATNQNKAQHIPALALDS